MRELFIGWDRTRLGLYQSLLESVGIRCFMRGYADYDGGAPTLCVVDDSDHPRAVEFLRQMQSPGSGVTAEWACPTCNEAVPGNFEVCWKCGEEQPA